MKQEMPLCLFVNLYLGLLWTVGIICLIISSPFVIGEKIKKVFED